jgi:subtilisin
MRWINICVLAACVLGTGCTKEALEDVFMGHYFVKLNSDSAKVVGTVNTLSEVFDFQPIHVYDNASEGFSVRMPHALAPEIEKRQEVEYVQRDDDAGYLDPDDPDQDPNDDLGNIDFEFGVDEIPPGILRMAHGLYDGNLPNFSSIEVAVIDTGADSNHPDLNIVHTEDIVGVRTGDDANGKDENGHGTHVAGTIGAIADGDGVAGVAPGIAIHAVRVLDDNGSGTWSDIIAGLEYVLENPEIRVVNMSLGGPLFPQENDPFEEAIQRLVDSGVVVCIAAGNEAQDTSGVAPAGYDLGVVVSAYDASKANSSGDNGFASFSNYGDEVDIAAPGVDIISTYPTSDYTLLSGTSMATPHVAGAMALYLADNPSATASQALNALVNSGEDNYSGQGGDHPEPFIDLEALLN